MQGQNGLIELTRGIAIIITINLNGVGDCCVGRRIYRLKFKSGDRIKLYGQPDVTKVRDEN